jgi:AcrR family transcriptional regulator
VSSPRSDEAAPAAPTAPAPTAPTAQPRRGRPRDAAVDERILTVAVEVYAERGWAGFNFDIVAQRAKVSKDAIYRRYSSKLDLLASSLGWDAERQPAFPPDGDLREYLISMARYNLQRSIAQNGLAPLRIFVEAPANPELLEAFHRHRSASAIRQARAVVRRAMDAGQLPDVTSPGAPLDAILGGVIMHVMATPPDLWERLARQSEDYLAELVDLVLRGCGYRAPAA